MGVEQRIFKSLSKREEEGSLFLPGLAFNLKGVSLEHLIFSRSYSKAETFSGSWAWGEGRIPRVGLGREGVSVFVCVPG